MMKSVATIIPLFASIASAWVQAEDSIHTDMDWSARSRYADFSGTESARAASLLLRLNMNAQWSDILGGHIQLDNVSRAFKNQHSDGVDLNGKPVIPDAGGFDINQAYMSLDIDSMSFKLGRQKINWDDQRFIGGNGFWQNEQTFDAALVNYKFLSNSQFSYAYIDNVNRIFGDDADKNLANSNSHYDGDGAERPLNFLGDHRHHTHISQLNFNEWDYSQVVAYAYAMNNLSMPKASNRTLGANYTLTYKWDAIKYRIKIESALQKQPEASTNPLLSYYLLDMSAGIRRYEFVGRYEILSHKDGVNFITPLASGHDFQGAANQVSNNYMAAGVKDASLGMLVRATPFKVEARYHQFYTYTTTDYMAQELDLTLSYKPSRQHAFTLLAAYFQPDVGVLKGKSARRIYVDYAYNF
jgi:Alginate export